MKPLNKTSIAVCDVILGVMLVVHFVCVATGYYQLPALPNVLLMLLNLRMFAFYCGRRS